MTLYDYQIIDLKSLDLSKDRFRISWGRNIEQLAKSIQSIGCLQPILLRDQKSKEIMDGFRRVEAAKQIGLDQIPVLYPDTPPSEKEALDAALSLFLINEQPNPVEQSIILRKLERHYSRDEIIDRYLPRLGLQQSAVVYRRLRSIDEMPEEGLKALAEGKLDPASIPYLDRLPPEDRLPAIHLLLHLRPTHSMQKEILEYLHDITLRDEVSIEQLLKNDRVQEILNQEPPNIPQQRNAFREWLKQVRFPVLHRMETAFEETRKQWKLGETIRLIPPPYYEGQKYEIRFPFGDPEDFKKKLSILEQIKNQPDLLKKLWPDPWSS